MRHTDEGRTRGFPQRLARMAIVMMKAPASLHFLHDRSVSSIIRRAAQPQLPAPWKDIPAQAGCPSMPPGACLPCGPACRRGRVCLRRGAGRGAGGSFERCGRGRAPGKGEGAALFNTLGIGLARAGRSHARARATTRQFSFSPPKDTPGHSAEMLSPAEGSAPRGFWAARRGPARPGSTGRAHPWQTCRASPPHY